MPQWGFSRRRQVQESRGTRQREEPGVLSVQRVRGQCVKVEDFVRRMDVRCTPLGEESGSLSAGCVAVEEGRVVDRVTREFGGAATEEEGNKLIVTQAHPTRPTTSDSLPLSLSLSPTTCLSHMSNDRNEPSVRRPQDPPCQVLHEQPPWQGLESSKGHAIPHEIRERTGEGFSTSV